MNKLANLYERSKRKPLISGIVGLFLAVVMVYGVLWVEYILAEAFVTPIYVQYGRPVKTEFIGGCMIYQKTVNGGVADEHWVYCHNFIDKTSTQNFSD